MLDESAHKLHRITEHARHNVFCTFGLASPARFPMLGAWKSQTSFANCFAGSADDVFNAYYKKNEVDFKGQESGQAIEHEADSRRI